MESLGIPADNSTLPLVLKACARLNDVERGRKIYSSIWDTGLSCDVRVGTALVDFYYKCGIIDDAREVFDQVVVKDVVLWNALIYGYVGCCYFEEAVWLFGQMEREGLKPNSWTVVALLLACREFQENEIMKAQDKLRSIHAKLSVLEGKMALAIIDAQKVVEQKQNRIDDARRALRFLRPTCIIWPNTDTEVLLAGSFDGWATKKKMEKSKTGIFSLCMQLYPDQIHC